jgi:hypothetical protein
VAVRIRIIEAIEFGKGDGLNNRELQLCPVPQVLVGLFAGQSVEKFPRGVAQVKERVSMIGYEKAPILRHLQLGQVCLGGGKCRGSRGNADHDRGAKQ